MDWLSEVDFASVIRESAGSALGVISLFIIVVGVVAVALFRSAKNEKIRLVAFALMIVGVGLLIFRISSGVDDAIAELQAQAAQAEADLDEVTAGQTDEARRRSAEEEAERIRIAALDECRSSATRVETSCRAYDKSGFHSSPSASCQLRLDAGDQRFFAQERVTVDSQNYRNLSGAPAGDATPGYGTTNEGARFVRSFGGSIGCTNAQGTGRTCESRATISASSYPLTCLAFANELRN